MRGVIVLLLFYLSMRKLSCYMLKNVCPHDEVHKSCTFYEEYTCYEDEKKKMRVKSIPKRLPHCRAGCYCRKGLVREFPQGSCILAMSCRNQELQRIFNSLPASFIDF
ncbi:unnamed protein product [Parnassius mnemosyne]|uniref:TIL domain-containing protein n=1 Tax=Parnassius mnemosyne TaxID=213953 RepID=A0AAV1KZP6_9NEOP